MRTTAALALLFLVACAGSSPPRTQYLLRAELVERAGRVEAPLRIALGRVAVAPYLDQSGILVETAARQVSAAREHEWAEPLADGLRSLLRAELSDALGQEVLAERGPGRTWDYTVDVTVDRLHGTMQGTAVLDASYWITPTAGAGEAGVYRFSRFARLPREGYAGLVDAEAELTRQLAQAIAGSFRELDATEQP